MIRMPRQIWTYCWKLPKIWGCSAVAVTIQKWQKETNLIKQNKMPGFHFLTFSGHLKASKNQKLCFSKRILKSFFFLLGVLAIFVFTELLNYWKSFANKVDEKRNFVSFVFCMFQFNFVRHTFWNTYSNARSFNVEPAGFSNLKKYPKLGVRCQYWVRYGFLTSLQFYSDVFIPLLYLFLFFSWVAYYVA